MFFIMFCTQICNFGGPVHITGLIGYFDTFWQIPLHHPHQSNWIWTVDQNFCNVALVRLDGE